MLNSFPYIQQILSALFQAEYRRLKKNETNLSRENSEVRQARLGGFMFQGRAYRDETSGLADARLPTLELSLWPKMQLILDDRKKVEHDKASIQQMLFRLMEPCQTLQEMRCAVPDCIVDTLPQEVASLERTFAVDFFLRHPRDYRQYERVLPLIEFYSAARLLY